MAKKAKEYVRATPHKKKTRQGMSVNTKRNQGKDGSLKRHRRQGNKRRRIG